MAHPKDNANRYPPTYAADGLDFRSETDALSTNAFDNRQYTMIESRSGPPINPDGSYVIPRRRRPHSYSMKVEAQPGSPKLSGSFAKWKLSDQVPFHPSAYIEHQHIPLWPLELAPRDCRSDYRPLYSNESPLEAEARSSSLGLDGPSSARGLPVALHPSVHMEPQRGTGKIRAEPVQLKRFEPHSLNDARAYEYSNAGPYAPYLPPWALEPLGPPPGLPSRPQSYATADPEIEQKNEREGRAMESNGTLVAREQGLPHGSSHEVQTVGTGGLVQWAVRVFKRPKTPTVNEALELALGILIVHRQEVISPSQLTTLKRTQSEPNLTRAHKQSRGRKEVERDILKLLCHYFKQDKRRWSRQKLLLAVTEEMLRFEAHWNELERLQTLR